MSDDRKRVSVRIAGINYQLAAAENEDYIRQLAIQADEMIRRVQQSNPYLNQTMATVLALVNALDENGQADRVSDQAVHQRDEAERKLAETRAELNKIREQNWDMKKDLLKMQGLLAEFEQHLEKLQDPEPEDDEEMESATDSTTENNEADDKKESESDDADVDLDLAHAADLADDFDEDEEDVGDEDDDPSPLNSYKQSRLEDFL